MENEAFPFDVYDYYITIKIFFPITYAAAFLLGSLYIIPGALITAFILYFVFSFTELIKYFLTNVNWFKKYFFFSILIIVIHGMVHAYLFPNIIGMFVIVLAIIFSIFFAFLISSKIDRYISSRVQESWWVKT